jgi:hypothetical protein
VKIVFQHLRDTQNVGDRWCSPFDWFEWPAYAEARDISRPGEDYDVGIYGGGKIFGGLSSYTGVRKTPGSLHIAWGVGTLQTLPISLRYARARRLCDIVGTRDWGDRRYEWAPCTSCMSPLFDAPAPPEHDVVFYYHGDKTEAQGIRIPADIPSLSNNANSLEEALAFIASGRTVVSNSYHGVYWALLMGRRALCVPFSRKFSAYRLPPGYAGPRNWLNCLDDARSQPEFLSLCRAATEDFYRRVCAAIEKRDAR